MMNRLGSPMSRGDANTIDYLNNQSVYSMEGTPTKEHVPVYDTIQQKSGGSHQFPPTYPSMFTLIIKALTNHNENRL